MALATARRLTLTAAQLEVSTAVQLDPGNPRYSCGGYVRITGPLDPDLLARAVRTALEETDALRSVLGRDGEESWQQVQEPAADPLRRLDLRAEPDPVAAAEAWMWGELGRPLRLDRDRLVDQALISVGPEEHLLWLRYHHVVLDGFGQALYWRRVAAVHSALAAGAEPPPASAGTLADVLADEAAYRGSPQATVDADHWARVLADPPDRAALAPGPAAVARSVLHRTVAAPRPLPVVLRPAATRHGTHWSVVVMAASAAYLHRIVGRDDLLLGLPVRARVGRTALTTPAMLANILPLRIRTTPDTTVGELIEQTARQAGAVLARQRVRGEELARAARREAGVDLTPALVLNIVGFDQPLAFGAATGTVRQLSSGPVRDLQVDVYAGGPDGGSAIGFEADADRYDAAEVAAHQDRFVAFLDRLAEAPDDTPVGAVELLTDAERQQLRESLTGPSRPYDLTRCLHELVDDAARRHPDAPAVLWSGGRLTHAELADRSDRLAAHLVRLGVGPGQPVGVLDVRSPELVVDLLAVLKAGGAYLPLDPELPPARLGFQVRDSGSHVVLTRSRLAGLLPADDAAGIETVAVDALLPDLPPAAPAPRRAGPEDPAYVIYTSGSTGEPKGVAVPHRGVVNRLSWMQDEYGLRPDGRVLQKTPFTFDVSVWEFFWPLLTGAALVLAEPGLHRDPRHVAALVREHGIDTVHFVPPSLDLFLAEPASADLPSLRRVITSGEALPARTVRRFLGRYGDRVELHNLYGPTEASVDVTAWRCGPADAAGPVPIGRPVANTRIDVVDPAGRPVPPGAVGELYLSGVQVALGYLNRPELTAERFVPDPDGPGRRYRTGDLGRLRADGAIEFLGRIDGQVKVRGQRIELGEVEAALLGRPEVAQAAVIAPEDGSGQRRLHAYVAPAVPGLDPAGTLAALREVLPAAAVPYRLTPLDALPLLSNGKVDRRRLVALAAADEPAADLAPATGPVAGDEELLRRVWSEVLGTPDVGPDDSFFALGGDSMLAIRVRAEVERHGRSFDVATLFEGPSVRRLAAALRPLDPIPGGRTEPYGLLAPADRAALPPDVEDAYPLAAMQTGMLYHAGLTTRSSVYRVVTSLRVEAGLDLAQLRAAVADTARRHPSLRCSFDLLRYSRPLQLVHREVTVPVEVGEDLGELNEEARRAAVLAWVQEAKFAEFDPGRPPLFRFTAHPCGPDAFQLSVVEHHVVLDGWSDMRMLEEVVGHYTARRSGEQLLLPAIPSTYRDFVAVEQRAATDPAARDFWAGRLRDSEPTELVPARVEDRPAEHVRLDVPLPAGLAGRLHRRAREAGLPVKALLTAAHLAVLRLVGGRDEVMTGVITNGRLEEPGGDEVIGVFLNTLPLRLDLAGADLVTVAHRVYEEETASYPYRRYPLAQMQRDLDGQLRLDSYVNVMDFHRRATRAGEPVSAVDVGVAETNYPLAVNFLAGTGRDELTLWLDCDISALPAEFCERLTGYYTRALVALADDPHAEAATVDLLGDEEQARLHAWGRAEADLDPAATVHGLVEERVRTAPDAAALAHRADTLTYEEVDTRANRLAGHLVGLGVGRGDLVGVSLRRGADLVVTLLAVLKAGAAYVPLDPSFPLLRLRGIAADAGLACLVRGADTPDGLTAPRVVDLDGEAGLLYTGPAGPTGVEVGGEDVAYVIYTSGSTGQPKGTAVRHRNVVNFFLGMDAEVGCEPEDAVLAVTSVSFDISVLELLWPLARGARVVVAGDNLVANLAPAPGAVARAPLTFSLFFFAAAAGTDRDGYRLVVEAAKFADRHGFEAVWTPERHFHEFGGLYPNPSVMAAALSTVTERIALRSGSVVAPLHDPVRLAEEWALVDNLSGGRVGLAFASGWNSNDFVLAPDAFADRKARMAAGLADFRALWRGDTVRRTGGSGQPVDVRTFPRPVQPEPPIWLTSVGTVATFEQAGAAGVNLLTHLLGQRPEDLADKLAAYRRARAEAGHPGRGHVTVMVHTYLGPDTEQARREARGPFREYLRSSTELWRTLFTSIGREFPAADVAEQLEAVLDLAVDRYFETSGLFGSPQDCAELVRTLSGAGVDEVACLVDFGVPVDAALTSLNYVDALRSAHEDEVADAGHSFAELCERHGVTLVQGTPSLLSAVAAEPAALAALRGVRTLLVGGEAFPAGLAETLLDRLPGTRVLNMYGPTETTIWSTVHELDRSARGGPVPIGHPIANTTLLVLDEHGRPVPAGVAGELWIGGEGVAVGYVGRPELTAERFPDRPEHGGRCYRTGDRVRWRADGQLEFLGRVDRQVKILGHRVEPDEVESVLSRHQGLEAVAVVARTGPAGGAELVAYVSPTRTPADGDAARAHVQRWGEVWEGAYTPADRDRFAGWNSSLTGKPIPVPEMEEWLRHTVRRVLDLDPRDVADIGVGVGLLLRELADRTTSYLGVDLSPAALEAAAGCLGPDRPLPAHVRLRPGGPEVLTELPPGSLDTVVLNSVVQYFPSAGYLAEALRAAVRAVRPGGAVFVGDVRSFELLPQFHATVQLARAAPLQTAGELRAAAARGVAEERELCLSPLFFTALRDADPDITEVRVEVKRGTADNELSTFRYDVTLLVGDRPAAPADLRLDWSALPDGLAGLRARLDADPAGLLVTGVPDRRLVRPLAAARLLAEAGDGVVAWELDRLLWDVDESTSVHPEELAAVAAGLGRPVRLTVPAGGAPGHLDVHFGPAGSGDDGRTSP